MPIATLPKANITLLDEMFDLVKNNIVSKSCKEWNAIRNAHKSKRWMKRKNGLSIADYLYYSTCPNLNKAGHLAMRNTHLDIPLRGYPMEVRKLIVGQWENIVEGCANPDYSDALIDYMETHVGARKSVTGGAIIKEVMDKDIALYARLFGDVKFCHVRSGTYRYTEEAIAAIVAAADRLDLSSGMDTEFLLRASSSIVPVDASKLNDSQVYQLFELLTTIYSEY